MHRAECRGRASTLHCCLGSVLCPQTLENKMAPAGSGRLSGGLSLLLKAEGLGAGLAREPVPSMVAVPDGALIKY